MEQLPGIVGIGTFIICLCFGESNLLSCLFFAFISSILVSAISEHLGWTRPVRDRRR